MLVFLSGPDLELRVGQTRLVRHLHTSRQKKCLQMENNLEPIVRTEARDIPTRLTGSDPEIQMKFQWLSLPDPKTAHPSIT